jgi:ATP-dependent exoDNAse (exonuclease V) beta subunit
LQKNHAFTVYNASAGSGKTFTLVKAYLVKLILSNQPDYFRNILAVTFTNKAVAEMKERILKNLEEFASEDILNAPSVLFQEVTNATGLNAEEIHKRAQRALNYVLHNYSIFDIETIDRFNHRIIRTFAKDLKLNSNFEVSLDTEELLRLAVDRLISKVGKDELLTRVMVDFALEKTDDDKSWNIAYDLNLTSKLLANETDLARVERLKSKTISDFLNFKTLLFKDMEAMKVEIISKAKLFIETLEANEISFKDFKGSYAENFFNKLIQGNLTVPLNAKWLNKFGEEPLYRKNEKPEITAAFEKITEQLAAIVKRILQLLHARNFYSEIYKKTTSLSLLHSIKEAFEQILDEKNVLTISSFNTKINKEIEGQPAPFIYERLGERYRHYFIDEFQDTSQLQWKNLIPLIDNSLSQSTGNQTGSLLLVGDAKQSIYRWRGGVPEQFIDIYNCKNPFSNEDKLVESLETNFRSFETVINFNNAFFSHSALFLENENHQQLYKTGNSQKTTSKKGGAVSLQFIEAQNAEEGLTLYPEKVFEIIQVQKENGFMLGEMCVLVRKKSQGIAVSEYLAEKGIAVISEETLLLKNAPEIQFLINTLRLCLNFDDQIAKADALYFLYGKLNPADSAHQFISDFLNYNQQTFCEKLKTHSVSFSFKDMSLLPVYEVCENIINAFHISSSAVAYVQAFLDFVYDFSLKAEANIQELLEFWEDKKDTFSIQIPDGSDAVKIMTIHKSKGLEFPVVIFPFADMDIGDLRMTKVWFPIPEETFHGFSVVHLNAGDKIASFSDEGAQFMGEVSQTAQLDDLNLVYVTFTRAVEQLHILSNIKKINGSKSLANLLHSFLQSQQLWQEGKVDYLIGDLKRKSIVKSSETYKNHLVLNNLISSKKEDHKIHIAEKASQLWDTKQEGAIEKGQLIHELLAQIITASQLETICDDFENSGLLSQEQKILIKPILEKIIRHPELHDYFSGTQKVIVEKDIYTKNGNVLRPDRINFIAENQIAIIDYKTGLPKETDLDQINHYESILNEMHLKTVEKIIVYIDETVEIRKF